MHSVTSVAVLATIAFSSVAIAHAGHDVAAEVAERAPLLARMPNVQTKCKKRMEASGYNKRAIERRQALVDEERARRGISNDSRWNLLVFRITNGDLKLKYRSLPDPPLDPGSFA